MKNLSKSKIKKKKTINDIVNNFNFFRKLINFWTIFYFSLIVYDFLFSLNINNILEIVSAIYIGVLAIYVGNKEFERWYNKHQGRHPGEIFVVFWTVLVFSLIFFGTLFKQEYLIPNSIISSYIAVLTILVVTRKSKQIYLSRRK